MTSALLYLLAQSPILLSEVPDPSAGRIRVEIVAGLPEMDAPTWAAAHALRGSLAQGTLNFTRFQLLQYATSGGDPPRITLAADHVRIGFSVPAGDLRLAVELTDELVRRALLTEEKVRLELDELPFKRSDPWTECWLPLQPEPKGVTRADVVELYRRAFAPGNLSIAVGGAIAPGTSRELGSRFAAWSVAPSRQRRRPGPSIKEIVDRSSPLTSLSLEGEEISVVPAVSLEETASPLGSAILAAAMLGQGKGSTAYRLLRDQHGWTYRQEAYLKPSAGGVRPALVLARSPGPELDALQEALRPELLKAIEAWTEADRERALALMKSAETLDLGLGVMYLAEARPLGSSLDDRTFLAAYGKLKAGRLWTRESLRAQMATATLIQAKAFAKTWIEKGQLRRIAGQE